MSQSVYRKALEPTETDIKTVRLVSRGLNNAEIAKLAKVTESAIEWRLKQLYYMTGIPSRCHLVYWMLDKGYLELAVPRKSDRVPPSPRQLEVVNLIAQGYPRKAIAKKLHLTINGVTARAYHARKRAKAINNAHLVAICWQENWIV